MLVTDRNYGNERFDGRDYNSWKIRVEVALNAENLGTLQYAGNKNTRRKKNCRYDEDDEILDHRKSIALIIRFLSNSHLTYATGTTYAWKIIQRLDQVYSQ